jgi:hypothetical protein
VIILFPPPPQLDRNPARTIAQSANVSDRSPFNHRSFRAPGLAGINERFFIRANTFGSFISP